MRRVLPLFPLCVLLFLPAAVSAGFAQAVVAFHPSMVTEWQWQLDSPPAANQLLNVKMYDVDGFDAPASLITAMHAKGIRAVCYIDVGTWENWRSDAARFPTTVEGRSNGWPGEKWLDIRQTAVLLPLMKARFQMCKAKGFDGIEPDNIDGYENRTGFPLTYQNQITYNSLIAAAAHSLGLSVALKNDVDQSRDLVSKFDFAIDEQCFEYDECDSLLPFVDAKKPVFEVEYGMPTSKFCPEANAMNFNSMLKDEDLTAYRAACR
ncbi:MAG TPA: endo alpha-1,4 polygalactosaminidase [Terriglobales bacterium]|nr:endo alpha-1,4 polygalactosaminidase [Terriglobales bacterium]